MSSLRWLSFSYFLLEVFQHMSVMDSSFGKQNCIPLRRRFPVWPGGVVIFVRFLVGDEQMSKLGVGFKKYVLFSPLFWARFPIWLICFKGVGSTTNDRQKDGHMKPDPKTLWAVRVATGIEDFSKGLVQPPTIGKKMAIWNPILKLYEQFGSQLGLPGLSFCPVSRGDRLLFSTLGHLVILVVSSVKALH